MEGNEMTLTPDIKQIPCKMEQVRILEDDRDNVVWEKAHLLLFILCESATTRWGQAIRRLNAAYLRGDMERFDIILDEMRIMAEPKR